MVLQNLLMTFFSVDRSLAGSQVELKYSNLTDGFVFLLPNPFLSEAICGRG